LVRALDLVKALNLYGSEMTMFEDKSKTDKEEKKDK